jgi:hypothetical protein
LLELAWWVFVNFGPLSLVIYMTDLEKRFAFRRRRARSTGAVGGAEPELS